MSGLPSIRQLQYLVAVVDLCHFGKAAERCFVSQSTLSAGLKELEELLQATLVERTRRTVLPTPLGEAIARQARDILATAETIVDIARSGGAPLQAALRLGVIPTIGPFVLPRVLKGLRKAYPELKLFLREDLTRPSLERLRKGELDAVLIALPHDVPDCEVMELSADPLWLIAPPDHPLMRAPRAAVSADELSANEVLLLEDGHCLREHALAACHLHPTPQSERFQATSLYSLVEMVANGLGVTFVPEIALSAGLVRGAEVAWKPLSDDSPPRRIGLVWRRSYHRQHDLLTLGAYLKGQMPLLRVKQRRP